MKNRQQNRAILTKKKIVIGGAALCVLIIVLAVIFSGNKKPARYWYVEEGLENAWSRILREAAPPERFAGTVVWDGGEIPSGPGVLIATRPRKTEEKVAVYPRLSWELEHEGAIVLALDPWMVFRKHTNPALTSERVLLEEGGSGLLLVAGKDAQAIRAWTSRFIQEEPGKFPSGDNIWREWDFKLLSGNRFAFGARGYDWQTALFRLMGNDPAWLYAPLSTIRRYRDPHKAILEATPFPELVPSTQYSLLANILWALPTGSATEQEELAPIIAWLKDPDTQTVIADIIEWIPADPYGKPYDPVSLSSHRIWLTAPWVYTLF